MGTTSIQTETIRNGMGTLGMGTLGMGLLRMEWRRQVLNAEMIPAQNVQLQNVTYMQLIDWQESSEQVSKLASFPGSPCVQTKK